MSAGYMRQCAGKDRHETKDQGIAARARLAASEGLPISRFRVYPCGQCLGYHVGSAGSKFKTRTRRPGKRASKKMRGRL